MNQYHTESSSEERPGPSAVESDSSPPAREVRYVVHLVLLVALYLAYLTLKSFLHPIVFAAVLASLCGPLHAVYLRVLNGRRNLAALWVVLTVAVGLVAPLLLFVGALATEGAGSVIRIQDWLQAGGVDTLLHHHRLAEWMARLLPGLPFPSEFNLNEQLLSYSKRAGEILLTQGAVFAANVVSWTAQFFLMLFVLFYLARDGRKLLAALKDLTPLRADQDDRIVSRIREMARSVFVGSIFTAICQGLAGGIGLALVGIPSLFWGTAMGVVSLIPMVGTALVWGPAVVYLLLMDQWGNALFLLVWCAVIVGSIDNYVRPFLMRGHGGLSPLFVFLSVLGGMTYFGLPGLLYGPLIVSFAAAMLYLYKEEFPNARQAAAQIVAPP